MIIVSQDKTTILNFDNLVMVRIEGIYTDNIEKADHYVIEAISEHQAIPIAKYKTKTRSTEVLHSMLNAISINMYKYNMPQK